MLQAMVLAAIFFFFVYKAKQKIAVTKQAGDGYMFGFHWGDSVESVAKWSKKLGFKYHKADNGSATIIYTGAFPGLVATKASYSFCLPHGKLDSLSVLISDASGYSYGTIRGNFDAKFGECWDDDCDNASWIAGDILIVLLQGSSGLVHLRYLNMNNMPEGETLEDIHDDVIDAIRAIDEELKRQT